MLLQLERKAMCWARKSSELLKEGKEGQEEKAGVCSDVSFEESWRQRGDLVFLVAQNHPWLFVEQRHMSVKQILWLHKGVSWPACLLDVHVMTVILSW